MQRVSAFLWIATAGAVLAIVAIAGSFYELDGEGQSAWYGVPHASDLILAAAVVALIGVVLTATERQPVRGRTVGLIIGVIGLLATMQLGYRMIVPPYGCLQFGCGFSSQADVTLLTGIWMALGGCIAVTLGGFGYALSGAGERTTARPLIAARQTAMTPWLGLAAVGAVAMFVFPFTVFTLYTVSGFFGGDAVTTWGGWLSLPHTSSLVLALAAIIVGLVIAAGRERSPLSPTGLGMTIALLAAIGGARILYRIIVDPFGGAGGAEDVQVGSVTTELAGYLGLAGALIAIGAAVMHALDSREPERRAVDAPAANPT